MAKRISANRKGQGNFSNMNFFDELGNRLDSVVGEEGIKSDIRITLAEKDYYSIFAVFVLGMTVGAIGQFFIHKMLNKMFG